MKIAYGLVSLALFWLGGHLTFGRTEDSAMPRGKPKTISVIAEKSGVELALTMPATCVAGQAIPCEVILTNKSKTLVWYGETAPWRDFIITIRDAKKNPVPFTRYGYDLLGGERGFGSRKFERLSPGKTLSQAYKLSQLFDLTVAGSYTISIERGINLTGRVEDDDHLILVIKDFKFVVSEPAP
jgi:hypothetical protein